MTRLFAATLGLTLAFTSSAFAWGPNAAVRMAMAQSAARASAARTNGLSVNVTSRPGTSGVVGRFNGISQKGATVNVARGGQTTFSLPANVANYNNMRAGSVGPGVTITRTDSGGKAHFTVTAK